MTVLTLVIPKKLHQQIERDKRKMGLSKSDIVRQIIMLHYAQRREVKITGAA